MELRRFGKKAFILATGLTDSHFHATLFLLNLLGFHGFPTEFAFIYKVSHLLVHVGLTWILSAPLST